MIFINAVLGKEFANFFLDINEIKKFLTFIKNYFQINHANVENLFFIAEIFDIFQRIVLNDKKKFKFLF